MSLPVVVADDCLNIAAFQPYYKHTTHGTAWAVTRIKASLRGAFNAIDDVGDEDALWGVAYGYRIPLEAALYAIPEWCAEFEQRFNEKLEGLWNVEFRDREVWGYLCRSPVDFRDL